jgi:hypothetical protein
MKCCDAITATCGNLGVLLTVGGGSVRAKTQHGSMASVVRSIISLRCISLVNKKPFSFIEQYILPISDELYVCNRFFAKNRGFAGF